MSNLSNFSKVSRKLKYLNLNLGGVQTTWTEFWANLTPPPFPLCGHFYKIAAVKCCSHLNNPLSLSFVHVVCTRHAPFHQGFLLPKNMLSEPECFEIYDIAQAHGAGDFDASGDVSNPTHLALWDIENFHNSDGEDEYQRVVVDTTRNPERFPGAIADRSILSALDCQKSCQESYECQFWSFSEHACFRKRTDEGLVREIFGGEITYGPKYCGQ